MSYGFYLPACRILEIISAGSIPVEFKRKEGLESGMDRTCRIVFGLWHKRFKL